MIEYTVPARSRRPLDVKRAEVYRPGAGDWSYSHHASVIRSGDRFHAIWSNGRVDEDDVGQRVLHSTSADAMTWDTPQPLFPTMPGVETDLVLTAGGFHQTDAGLVAYAGVYEYARANIRNGSYITINKDHERIDLIARTTTDGSSWTDVRSLGVPIVPNHGPQRIGGGRLVISGNFAFPWTDDTTGLTGWRMTALPGSQWDNWYDDPEGKEIAARLREDGVWLCEGSFWEDDDGTLTMLLRSRETRLYVSQSRDRGESWSTAVPTRFPDCGTKFHCGRLADGRYYIVSCPDPDRPRTPLVLSLSNDGRTFDRAYVIEASETRQRYPGRHKGGVYGYPHTFVHESTMYVICSIQKEDVVVFHVDLEQVA